MRRTWKQRSVIRKHAWGACNSLAIVLACGDVPTADDNISTSQRAVQAMVQCIQHIGSINEKVVLAAVAALGSLSVPTWSQVSVGTGIVGMALSACLLEVYKVRDTNDATRCFCGSNVLLDFIVCFASISYLAKFRQAFLGRIAIPAESCTPTCYHYWKSS